MQATQAPKPLQPLKAVKAEEEPEKKAAKEPALRVVALDQALNRALTLTGDYTDIGEHHNRRSYQRIPDDGRTDVFLYYWDSRDDPTQGGWWFGNALGGEEVWARHEGEDEAPPSKGWKVPWDTQTQTDLIGVELLAQADQERKSAEDTTISKAQVDKLVEDMKPLWARCTEALEKGEELEELQELILQRQKSTMEFSQRLQKQIGALTMIVTYCDFDSGIVGR